MSNAAQTESNLSFEISDLRKQVRRLSRLLSTAGASPADLTITQWCARRGISKSKFYVLKAAGKAPELLAFDGILRITPAADAAWERARRAETATHLTLEE